MSLIVEGFRRKVVI